MSKVKLLLKPHPACENRGEIIEVYVPDGGKLPWATVHIDTFHIPGVRVQDNQLYKLLYFNKEEVVVTLTIDGGDDNGHE